MLDLLTRQGETEGQHRATVELALSCNPTAYAVEDDKFLYYAQNQVEADKVVKVFHIVKGKIDYAMQISEWEEFAKLMLSVDDEFFVSGEGSEFKESFLGNYLSRYNRRQEFVNNLMCIIDDAKGWLE